MTPIPRTEFAVTRDYVYLNHASAGVLPNSSIAAIEKFARGSGAAGVLSTFAYDLRMSEYRERIGRFIGADGDEIAMIPATGAGANVIALGLDWKPGDEVLLADDDFPANVVPWLALRRHGVAVRFVRIREGRLTPDRLRTEISPRTRVVALSWVSYADGYRHDLAALAEVAHRSGALLCVDAMQGLGALPLDVRAGNLDAVYAGGAKWMLALHGIGFLFVARELRERLALAMPGWRSMRDMWDFHNYDQPYAQDAMRFEGGTPNLLGTLSIVSAIELFERAGTAQIAAHIAGLTDRLCDGLQRIGARLVTVRGQLASSGIVTFEMPGRDSIEIGRSLERQSIITTYRSSGIRVSPHGYNTEAEIDAALDALRELAPIAVKA
ncbi:MAG: aminotransferase class V-fold PLP-dependent enzyme [Candidatus Eremiobacteraeota bacterium]|nr:aminotransferase class V-fold PLP-dependent enzyme [Candidatus Eremiobacteraeota bacterium]MBV9698523.1 aminotransferase class V-fold PLP-dependent enzyme [Candidatus Eremiobacteraeota bacterium]